MRDNYWFEYDVPLKLYKPNKGNVTKALFKRVSLYLYCVILELT